MSHLSQLCYFKDTLLTQDGSQCCEFCASVQYNWCNEFEMEKYVLLFVLALTINTIRGQINFADISGPVEITNVRSFRGPGASVTNVVNVNRNGRHRFVNAAEANGPVVIKDIVSDGPIVITGASSTVIGESSVAKHLHDDATIFPLEGYKDYKSSKTNNKYKEVQGPVVAAHVKVPAVLTNLGNGNTKSPPVVNVINTYHEDQSLKHGDSKGSVINGDSSVVKHSYYGNTKDNDYYYDGYDIDSEDEENEDIEDNYGHPLIIHSTGPAGISIQNLQSDGAHRSSVSITNVGNEVRRWNYYPAQGAAINVGPSGISTHTSQNSRGGQSSAFIINADNQGGQSISIGPSGVFIRKVQNSGDQRFSIPITNGHNQDPKQNNNLFQDQTISVGPAGVSIHKVQNSRDQKPQVSLSNVYDQSGRQNYYPAKEEIINVGPSGIFIQKVKNGGDRKSSVSITNSR